MDPEIRYLLSEETVNEQISSSSDKEELLCYIHEHLGSDRLQICVKDSKSLLSYLLMQ